MNGFDDVEKQLTKLLLPIAAMFPKARITLVARTPDVPGADLLLTTDEIPAVITVLRQHLPKPPVVAFSDGEGPPLESGD